MKSAHHGDHAYSLPEVMITVLLVAAMVISLYAGFTSGFAVIQLARENLRATQILMQRMETIRLYRWGDQLLDTTNYLKPTFVELYDPSGKVTNSAGARYTGKVDLSIPPNLPAAYQTNMRAITVTVYWTNYSGTNKILRARQMQTYAAKHGMQNYIFGR